MTRQPVYVMRDYPIRGSLASALSLAMVVFHAPHSLILVYELVAHPRIDWASTGADSRLNRVIHESRWCMHLIPTLFPEVVILIPEKRADHRGFFSEVYSTHSLEALGINARFVQDNHSFSRSQGTVRGLHFQAPPVAQAKLVRVVRGAVFDVVVDVRFGSPTFGRHISIGLDAQNWRQIFVPPGFAHGFCTLAPDTEVVYKASAPYAPECEGGVLWNDPALGIKWPISPEGAVLSDKDRHLPMLAELRSSFNYHTAVEGERLRVGS